MKKKTVPLLIVLISLIVFVFEFSLGFIIGHLSTNPSTIFNTVIFDIITDIIIDAMVVIFVITLIRKILNRSISSLFNITDNSLEILLLCISIAFILFSFNLITSPYMSFMPYSSFFEEIYKEILPDHLSGFEIVLLFISYTISTPIVEELLFRGFYFNLLRNHFGFWGSFLLLTLVFYLFHLDPRAIAYIIIANYAFCNIYEKTKNLFFPVLLHSLLNLLSLLNHYVFN